LTAAPLFAGHDPFSFRGVTPGVTGEADVLGDPQWGEPAARSAGADGASVLEFSLPGYRRGGANVFVVVRDGRVRTVDVLLPEGFTPGQVAEVFELGEGTAEELTADARLGARSDGAWRPRKYSAGAAVLFLGAAPGAAESAELMRFYSVAGAGPTPSPDPAPAREPAVSPTADRPAATPLPATSSPSDWTRHRAKGHAVSLAAPPDWKPAVRRGSTLINLVPPGAGTDLTVSAFVTFVKIKEPQDALRKTVEVSIKTTRKTSPDTKIDPVRWGQREGRPAALVSLQRSVSKKAEKVLVQVFVHLVEDTENIYFVQAQCPVADLERWRRQLEKIIDSFQFGEASGDSAPGSGADVAAVNRPATRLAASSAPAAAATSSSEAAAARREIEKHLAAGKAIDARVHWNTEVGPCEGTFVHQAALAGHGTVVAWLLERGVPVNDAGFMNKPIGGPGMGAPTALALAAWAGHQDVVELLVSQGADLGHRRGGGDGGDGSALWNAIAQGHLGIAKFLVEKGAPLGATEQGQPTPLHAAAAGGYFQMVEWLLERRLPVNHRDGHGRGALDLALFAGLPESGYPAVATLLILKGADVRHRDGDNPLSHAARLGDRSLIELMVSRGASLTRPAQDSPPLHTAVSAGHVSVVAYLLEAGASIEQEDGYSRTPLHVATDRKVFFFLLEKGASVHARDGRGNTPLHSAALENVDRVRHLISLGAEVNARNQAGETPLHLAAEYNRQTAVEALLEAKADATLADGKGRTPADRTRNPELKKTLSVR